MSVLNPTNIEIAPHNDYDDVDDDELVKHDVLICRFVYRLLDL